MDRSLIAALLLATSAGCLQSREGPPLHPQARVSYGTRIYLADRLGFPPQASGLEICSRLTTTVETAFNSTSTPSTLDELLADEQFFETDGGPPLNVQDLRRPQTCFVPIVDDDDETPPEDEPNLPTNPRAGTLLVDRFEVTNDLFQFCIDSGFCAEPDPSESDQNDICSVEGEDNGFFDCPAVEVTLPEARRFCQYIGRRLPTAVESLLIRQAAWAADPETGTRVPETMRPYPAEAPGEAPVDCPDAHLGNFGCGRPERIQTTGSDPSGAAPQDEVVDAVLQTAPIADLTGHVAEWAGDGFPPSGALPWFCLGPVNREPTEGRPECPQLELPDGSGGVTFQTGCVYGYYDPDDLAGNVWVNLFDDGLGEDPAPGVDLPYGLYPVCVIGNTGRFAGSQGFLFGGSWRDSDALDPDLAGSFGRRVESSPDEFEDSTRAQGYGFRCVDDREPGLDDQGRGFPFESVPPGGTNPGPQIDVNYDPTVAP